MQTPRLDSQVSTERILTRSIPAAWIADALMLPMQYVRKKPKGFGRKPETYRYDVIYLMDGLTPATAIKRVLTRPGVDEARTGPGVLYFSRLIVRASQSRLTRIIGLPIYQQMTIRNWNTTTRLLALMQARGKGIGD